MDHFFGPDFSLRSCALCMVDSKGTMRLEREFPGEVSAAKVRCEPKTSPRRPLFLAR